MLLEFDYLQKNIDKLDAHRFQVRNWAVTTAGATFAISYSAKLWIIGLGGILTTLFFFFLEVIYLSTFVRVKRQSDSLEQIINRRLLDGRDDIPYRFGLASAFKGTVSLRAVPSMLFKAGRVHVTAFYLGRVTGSGLGSLSVFLFRPSP